MNVKDRITPTHFIEVYKGLCININDVMPIKDLQCDLMATKELGFETLFIWKIKCKNL